MQYNLVPAVKTSKERLWKPYENTNKARDFILQTLQQDTLDIWSILFFENFIKYVWTH